MTTAIQQSDGSMTASAGTTEYFCMFGWAGAISTTEANTQYKVNAALTAQNLYITISSNPLTGASTFITRKNTANGNLSVSIPGGSTGKFEDTVDSDSLAVGDIYNYKFTAGSGSGTLDGTGHGITFAASSATKLQGDAQTLSVGSAVTTFATINGGFQSSTTESDVQFKTEVASTLSRLATFVSANSITATDTVTLRKNGVNGSMSLSIGGSATGYFEQSPLSTTDSLAVGDLVDYQIVTGTKHGATTTFEFIAVQEQTSDSFHMVIGNAPPLAVNPNSTQYALLAGAPAYDATESHRQLTLRSLAGTASVKNLFVRVIVAGSGTNTVGTRKNGVNGNLSVSLGTGTGVFEDLTDTDTYATGDLANYVVVFGPSATGPTISYVSTQWTAISRTVMDTVIVNDLTTQIQGWVRSPADTLVLGDSVQRIKGWVRSPADTLVLGDSVQRIKGWVRSPADTLIFNDVTTRVLAATRSLADTLIFVDTLSRTQGWVRSLADTLVFGDSISATLTKAGFTRTVMDTLVFNDFTQNIQGWLRNNADTLIFNDVTTRVLAATRNNADTLVFQDVLSRTQGWVRSSVDTLVFNDLVSRTLAALRNNADALVFNDTLSRIQGWVRSPVDTLVFNDFTQRILAATRSLADTLVLGDSVQRIQGWLRNNADALVFSDLTSATVMTIMTRMIVDTLVFADAPTRTLQSSRTVVDTFQISESITVVKVVTDFRHKEGVTTYFVLRKKKARTQPQPYIQQG